MISLERKKELAADLEQAVDRYLDKQLVLWQLSDAVAENQEEVEWLRSLCSYYKVFIE